MDHTSYSQLGSGVLRMLAEEDQNRRPQWRTAEAVSVTEAWGTPTPLGATCGFDSDTVCVFLDVVNLFKDEETINGGKIFLMLLN